MFDILPSDETQLIRFIKLFRYFTSLVYFYSLKQTKPPFSSILINNINNEQLNIS